jgi:hypothetical protein
VEGFYPEAALPVLRAPSMFGRIWSALTTNQVTLYRSVSESEYAHLMQTGRFAASSNSLGGKFFAESAADAAKWGQALGNPRVVSATFPRNVADQFMRWERLDGIGPARYGTMEQMKNYSIRSVQ